MVFQKKRSVNLKQTQDVSLNKSHNNIRRDYLKDKLKRISYKKSINCISMIGDRNLIQPTSKSNVPNIANQAYQQQCRSKDSKREDSKGKKIKNFVKDNIKNISYIRDSRMQKSQYNFQKSLPRVDANLNTAHAAAPKEVNPKISEYKNLIRRQKNVKTNSTSQSVEGNKSCTDNRRSVVLNKVVSNCDYIVKSEHEQVELKSSLKCMILQMQKRQKPHKNKENMSFVVVSNTAHGNPRFKSSRPSFGGCGNR